MVNTTQQLPESTQSPTEIEISQFLTLATAMGMMAAATWLKCISQVLPADDTGSQNRAECARDAAAALHRLASGLDEFSRLAADQGWVN